MALAVETKGLTKVYKGKVRALENIDLRVPRGSAFGLLGPNGAGKSTLVKTLLGIVRPTEGEAWLLDHDIGDAEARRKVGYLPEKHRFPLYLTGRGVCRYFGKLSGLGGSELDQEVEAKLALVGMEEWADRKITKYSKGMLQRVGLAQAMLGKPELIILDEPTDGVDPVGRHQIRELIKQLCKEGTTVFLNSHLLFEVEQICDHVAILHHGRILQQGSVEEVRKEVRADRGGLVVHFATGKLGKEARAAVGKIAKVEKTESGFSLSLKEQSEISEVIDALRAQSVPIYAVTPTQRNLEEAFIDMITAQEDQSVGALS